MLRGVVLRGWCQGSWSNENIAIENNQTSWDGTEQSIEVRKVLCLIPLKSGWRDEHLSVVTSTPSNLLDCEIIDILINYVFLQNENKSIG